MIKSEVHFSSQFEMLDSYSLKKLVSGLYPTAEPFFGFVVLPETKIASERKRGTKKGL